MFYDFLTLKEYFKNYKLIKIKIIKLIVIILKKSTKRFIQLFFTITNCSYRQYINVSWLSVSRSFSVKRPYEKSFSYPNDYLINAGFGKYILRKV